MLDDVVVLAFWPSYWIEYSTTYRHTATAVRTDTNCLAPVLPIRTFSDSVCSTMPMGMKMRPTTAKVPMTQLGVRMGCQALSFCCLKGVSTQSAYVSQSATRGHGQGRGPTFGLARLLVRHVARSLWFRPLLSRE